MGWGLNTQFNSLPFQNPLDFQTKVATGRAGRIGVKERGSLALNQLQMTYTRIYVQGLRCPEVSVQDLPDLLFCNWSQVHSTKRMLMQLTNMEILQLTFGILDLMGS